MNLRVSRADELTKFASRVRVANVSHFDFNLEMLRLVGGYARNRGGLIKLSFASSDEYQSDG
jgi:hypothetical protein